MTATIEAPDAVARAGTDLAGTAPELVAGFHAALPRAVDVVGRRLLGAAWREDLGTARATVAPAGRYGFDRVRLSTVDTPPDRLLAGLGVDSPGLAAELTDACVNLAIAYARRARIDDDPLTATGLDPDTRTAMFERLPTEGHNLHPCGRTRLGWRVPDVLAHDQESPGTRVGFVAVRHDVPTGDDVGALLGDRYPRLPAPPPGYRLHPVHAWQLATVIPDRYADLVADRAILPLPGVELAAAPTTALRTVLVEPDAHGRRHYLKLSLDIQVTSTRRTISVASTRNGPALSTLLTRLLAGEERVLLLPEVAGAAVDAGPGRDRDLSVIVRGGLAGRLHPGEVAIPGPALFATHPGTGRPVVDALIAGDPLGFLDGYARLLLPPLLRLAAHGVGFEAHLQNSIPTFVAGTPHRLVLRDLAGARLHLPRLAAAAGADFRLWPGSVIGTGDVDVMRAKLGYTALQAHLGELVVHLVDGHGVAERDAWRTVRAVLDDCAPDRGDHAFLTAPVVPHKALVRMRLAGSGDVYVPVRNPLHAP